MKNKNKKELTSISGIQMMDPDIWIMVDGRELTLLEAIKDAERKKEKREKNGK